MKIKKKKLSRLMMMLYITRGMAKIYIVELWQVHVNNIADYDRSIDRSPVSTPKVRNKAAIRIQFLECF